MTNLEKDVMPLLGFSLRDHASWQDGYHIPEFVVPRLVSRAATVVCDLEPESACDFADFILDHSNKQFGLYTEGYTRLLAGVANEFGRIPLGFQPAADLRRRMLYHVSSAVFARRERIAGLLNCSQHLARLGATEDAERAFQESIEASLGPNWYKEAQFGLLTEALDAVGDAEFTRSQWKKAIETLAYASGESTFQRFVRDTKAI